MNTKLLAISTTAIDYANCDDVGALTYRLDCISWNRPHIEEDLYDFLQYEARKKRLVSEGKTIPADLQNFIPGLTDAEAYEYLNERVRNADREEKQIEDRLKILGGKGDAGEAPARPEEKPANVGLTIVNCYPRELRGPSNNRYGGHRGQRIRGLRGNTYGAASRGRRLVGAERETVVQDLKRRGVI